MVVQDWNEINKDFLEKKWLEFKDRKFNMKRITLEYWLKKIEKPKIHFITYGNYLYENSKARLLSEAKNFDEFNIIKGYGPGDLSDNFKKEYADILNMPRGGGYWIWRFEIIKNFIEIMNDGDILLYADAGSTLNNNGKIKFNEYINKLHSSEYGILSFRMEDQPTKYWTTKEIFNIFEGDITDEIKNSGQYLGGIFFLKSVNMPLNLLILC